MIDIDIPNEWDPRPYQEPLFSLVGHGLKYQRASVIWHRRAGKDSTMLNLTCREMFSRVGTYWHLFPEQNQARKAIWNGIDKAGRRIIDQVFPEAIRRRKSEQEMMVELVNGSTWQLAGSDNYDSLVGSNPVGVCFSEYALSNPTAWDYIRPILLENGGWALFNTTPRGRNHAYELHMMAQGNPNWFSQILTVDDTGSITPEQIQQERDDGMPESKVQQEFYCSFEAETEEQFIPTDVVLAARKRQPGPNPESPMILGVDVARFGDDKSVIYPRIGHDAQTLEPEIYAGLDTMQLSARVADMIQRLNARAVFVDEGGVGGGVVDRLLQLGFSQVRGVNFGWSSDRKLSGVGACANKRTEMWASMREALKRDLCLWNNDALAFELLAPMYDFDRENRMMLEKKADMKKRGVRSPDCFVAGTMVMTPRGEVPIEDLRVGDEVVAPFGTRRVIATHKTIANDLASVTLPNGRALTGKPKHRVYVVGRGLTPLSEVTHLDKIEMFSIGGMLSWRLLNLWFTKGRNIGFKARAATISQEESRTRSGFFTDGSTLTLSGQSLMASTSITLMETGRTTTWAIWNWLTRMGITLSTCRSGSRIHHIAKPMRRLSPKPRMPRASGMGRTPGSSGTVSTGSGHGKDVSPWRLCVSSVARSIKRTSRLALGFALQPAASGQACVQSGPTIWQRARCAALPLEQTHTARREHAAGNARTSSRRDLDCWQTMLGRRSTTDHSCRSNAQSVARSSGASGQSGQNTALQSAQTGPGTGASVAVYNLTLDAENMYYANGALVENCADALALTWAYPVATYPIADQIADTQTETYDPFWR